MNKSHQLGRNVDSQQCSLVIYVFCSQRDLCITPATKVYCYEHRFCCCRLVVVIVIAWVPDTDTCDNVIYLLREIHSDKKSQCYWHHNSTMMSPLVESKSTSSLASYAALQSKSQPNYRCTLLVHYEFQAFSASTWKPKLMLRPWANNKAPLGRPGTWLACESTASYRGSC